MEIKPLSYRAMRQYEKNNSIMYRLACDCGSKADDVIIDFEREEDGEYTISFYVDMNYGNYWQDNFIQGIIRRIKGALRLLFIGYIEMETDIIIGDKEHIETVIRVFKEGLEKLKLKED